MVMNGATHHSVIMAMTVLTATLGLNNSFILRFASLRLYFTLCIILIIVEGARESAYLRQVNFYRIVI